MTAQSPLPDLMPSLSSGCMSMADLLERMNGDEALTVSRRRNVCSSIRRLCELLNLKPQRMPAAFWALRERLAGFEPLAGGVSIRRFQTIKSDVAFALKRVSAPVARPRPVLSNAWLALKTGAGCPWRNLKIGRLAGYCSARGIAPADVDDDVISGYRSFLERQTFKTSAQRHVRDLCGHWNRLAATEAALGLATLTLPDGRVTYAIDWDALEPLFRGDADRWLHSLSRDADLFDVTAPTRPLKDSSIRSYRFKIRQMVGALREQGRDPAELQHLEDLVDLERVRAIAGFFQKRGSRGIDAANGKIADGKIADGNVIHVLRMIARYTRPDDEALHQRLKSAHARTSPGARSMGKRPQAALRQFDDPANLDALLRLPGVITSRLDRLAVLTAPQAFDYQSALALELLIMRPIRLKNLVALRIGEHVLRDAAGTLIVIPADEVKNDVALEHVLPAVTAALLERYVARALPVLSADRSGRLFPGAIAGRHKAQENLAKQITRLVRRHTGLTVSPHLMRHIGAKLYLLDVPEGLETVRQVLGHKSADTTARSYVGLQNAAAIARYDDLVLARRGQLAPQLPSARVPL